MVDRKEMNQKSLKNQDSIVKDIIHITQIEIEDFFRTHRKKENCNINTIILTPLTKTSHRSVVIIYNPPSD